MGVAVGPAIDGDGGDILLGIHPIGPPDTIEPVENAARELAEGMPSSLVRAIRNCSLGDRPLGSGERIGKAVTTIGPSGSFGNFYPPMLTGKSIENSEMKAPGEYTMPSCVLPGEAPGITARTSSLASAEFPPGKWWM